MWPPCLHADQVIKQTSPNQNAVTMSVLPFTGASVNFRPVLGRLFPANAPGDVLTLEMPFRQGV